MTDLNVEALSDRIDAKRDDPALVVGSKLHSAGDFRILATLFGGMVGASAVWLGRRAGL